MSNLNNEKLIETINLKNEEIKNLKSKIIELKNDLGICLKNNDCYNLELRKYKLYNFLFIILFLINIINYMYSYFFY